MDFDLPADDDPRRLTSSRLARRTPRSDERRPARGRVHRAPLAGTLRTRRRPDAPAHHRRRAQASRRRPHLRRYQCDRRRVGGTDDLPGRHRLAEGTFPPQDLHRRGGVVPAVQRTGFRLRPREPRHASGPGWRRVRHQRLEDLVVRRPSLPVRHPHRSDRPRRPEAQGHLVLHRADGPPRRRAATRSST